MNVRLPAEWEPQDGVLLAWPHAASDWRDSLDAVQPVFIRLTQEIARVARVVIVCPEGNSVRDQLRQAGVDLSRVVLIPLPANDTWTRDFGPITVLEEGRPVLLDFGFNGWGLKFPAYSDNQLTARLAQAGVWGQTPVRIPGLVLEGGSIDSDGNGTLLTTSSCLLSPNRNPHLNRRQIEEQLARLLGSAHILWLDNGYLAGDDTDAHIDTLARFCPNDTIAYMRCDDPKDEHHAPLAAMEAELQAFRTRDGRPYRLVPLPWPDPCYAADGHRLPATYANFLCVNGVVLVPTYGVGQDQAALDTVARLFPGHTVTGIHCRPLIEQHGSLHCVTMQLPKGVLP